MGWPGPFGPPGLGRASSWPKAQSFPSVVNLLTTCAVLAHGPQALSRYVNRDCARRWKGPGKGRLAQCPCLLPVWSCGGCGQWSGCGVLVVRLASQSRVESGAAEVRTFCHSMKAAATVTRGGPGPTRDQRGNGVDAPGCMPQERSHERVSVCIPLPSPGCMQGRVPVCILLPPLVRCGAALRRTRQQHSVALRDKVGARATHSNGPCIAYWRQTYSGRPRPVGGR